MTGPVSVVAGILVEDDRVVLVHRSPSRRWYPDVWDLPGGHVEPGESTRCALSRELREELGVLVQSAVRWGVLEVPGLVLDFWLVTEWTGTPGNRAPEEHDDVRWFDAAELPTDLAHPGLGPLLRSALTMT